MSSIEKVQEKVQEFENKLKERLTVSELKSLLIRLDIPDIYFGDIIVGLKYTLTEPESNTILRSDSFTFLATHLPNLDK